MSARSAIIRGLLEGRTGRPQVEAEAFAPANIALCKYWGKRDPERNLPVTDSLSLSLGSLGTRCRLAFSTLSHHTVSLNGTALAPGHPFSERLFRFLDDVRGTGGPSYRVITENTIPTAAGFASSASGFAALVMALDALHGWSLSDRERSILARLGSGSACRSLWQGFVHWHAGAREDGMDSYAEPLDADWPELEIGLLVLEGGRKSIGSTDAMRRTVDTSALYTAWPAKVAADLAVIRQAILTRDFKRLGATAESNALAMHATMIAAWPPVLYWQRASIEAMQAVWGARHEGLGLYFTMDAGPNLKLLFQANDRDAVRTRFPSVIVANRHSRARHALVMVPTAHGDP